MIDSERRIIFMSSNEQNRGKYSWVDKVWQTLFGEYEVRSFAQAFLFLCAQGRMVRRSMSSGIKEVLGGRRD